MTLMLMHILSGASGIGFNLYDFRHHFPRTTFALLVTYLGPLLAATAISLGTAKNGFPYLLEITWLAVGWICIKSFLVLPTVVSSGRVSILEGWRNTHGRFFRSAALICLSFLLVLTVQVALFIPLAFLLEWLGVEGWKFVFSLMNLSSPPMYAASTSVFAGTAFNWVDENLTAAVLPGPAS